MKKQICEDCGDIPNDYPTVMCQKCGGKIIEKNIRKKNKKVEVTDWIDYHCSNNYEENGVGGMGGWFNWTTKGQRWRDYLNIWKPKVRPYLEAIRRSVIKNNIRINGNGHQYSKEGVPLFNDNTISKFSFRGWGDLMAAIWSEEENKDYSYMDFYC